MSTPPTVPGVTFTDGKISRGKQQGSTTNVVTRGYIHHGGNINNGKDVGWVRNDIIARNYWVIIHSKSGKICWTGKITEIVNDWQWSFEVHNSLNDFGVDATSGESTVTVTVINPDTGPSNPTAITVDVIQVD